MADTPDPAVSKEVEAAPPAPPPPPPASAVGFSVITVDVALRVLLFAAVLVSVVVMSTAKQTQFVSVPGIPIKVGLTAKFQHSPAFIYFVAALSVVGFYSLITVLASISVIWKPAYAALFLLFFTIGDVLMLGLVASATGTAAGVAYIGLKGNSHVRWAKICNVYDTFCKHIGSAVAISLFASVVLVVLISLSVFSLHKKISK